MKKRVLIGLVISMAILGYFYSNRQYDDANRLILEERNRLALSATRTSKERREVYDEHGNLIEIWDDADDKLIEKRVYIFVVSKDKS